MIIVMTDKIIAADILQRLNLKGLTQRVYADYSNFEFISGKLRYFKLLSTELSFTI